MGIVLTGKNLVRDLLTGNSTDTLTTGGVGVLTTAWVESDTGLFGGTTQIDACDAVTGWANAGDANAETLNTTAGERQEGTGCLNLPMTFSAGSGTWSKTISTQNMAADKLYAWYYIADKSALTDATDAVRIILGTGGYTNINNYDFARDNLNNGWNTLLVDVDTATSTGGTGADETDIDSIRIKVKADSSISTNNQRMDNWRFLSAGTDGVTDSQNAFDSTDVASDKVIKIAYTLANTESNGYSVSEFALVDTNGDLFLREVFTGIDKDANTQLQVDSLIYIL